MMNYWASNCPPCRAEMPHFERVWQDYKDRVLIIGLDVGQFFPFYGDEDQCKRALKELSITYPAGTAPDRNSIRDLAVPGLPSTSFITPEGVVHKTWVGILNSSNLTELIEGLLEAS